MSALSKCAVAGRARGREWIETLVVVAGLEDREGLKEDAPDAYYFETKNGASCVKGARFWRVGGLRNRSGKSGEYGRFFGDPSLSNSEARNRSAGHFDSLDYFQLTLSCNRVLMFLTRFLRISRN
jgi:hypothetical protein